MASWTKPQAERAADDIADALAAAFGIERPEVRDMKRVHGDWPWWEWQAEARALPTLAGPADATVMIRDGFAHLFFCFDDPARALAQGFDDLGRLNRASGKWNRWTGPELDPDLSAFVNGCLDDFRRAAGLVPVPAT